MMSPVELNKHLLSTLFNVKPKLNTFLFNKTGVDRSYYTLVEILNILKKIMREENLFDQSNFSIVMCSPELEEAINAKALHVTQIRDYVLSQLKSTQITVPNIFQVINGGIYARNDVHPTPFTHSINTRFMKDSKCLLKPRFLNVLRSVHGCDQTKTIFTYQEVLSLFSLYILSRKDEIFDHRNIELALVENDPIGGVFGVKVFHRCQVNKLLSSQLISVYTIED
jgi:hypothetical protein